MIDDHSASRITRLLPRVLAVTFVVVVFPSLVVYGVRTGGLISSALLGTALAALISLLICYLAGVYWEKHRATRDALFGDLLLWGWLRRWLIERRLETAISALGLDSGDDRPSLLTLSVEHRVKMLERLAADLEVRDPYTHGHSRRVARYSSLIASRMGLPRAQVAKIRAGAALHDVGKLETPIAILHKPGKLDDEEFEQIKRHPGDGAVWSRSSSATKSSPRWCATTTSGSTGPGIRAG